MKVINHVIAQNSKVCVYQACTNLNCDFETFKWQHLKPQFSLWKTMEIFWFGLKPSLHLPGHWVQRKKNPTLYIFLKHRFIFSSCKAEIELFHFVQGTYFVLWQETDDRGKCVLDWFQTCDCDYQGSLIRNWKMTAKELFLLNTFSSIRAGPSLYAFESLVSLQTLSNPSFAFAKRLPKLLACNE